jgi:hypothetical protein
MMQRLPQPCCRQLVAAPSLTCVLDVAAKQGQHGGVTREAAGIPEKKSIESLSGSRVGSSLVTSW